MICELYVFGDKNVNYVVCIPDCCKTQRLCNDNVLKSYWEREEVTTKVATITPVHGQVEVVAVHCRIQTSLLT